MNLRKMMLAGLFAVMAGCGGGGGGGGGAPQTTGTTPPPATPHGSISGTLTVPGTQGKPRMAPIPPSEHVMEDVSPTQKADFVPGEIILRFRDGVVAEEALSKILRDYQDVQLINAGQLHPEGPYLLRTNVYKNASLSRKEAQQQTEEVIAKLNAEPSVKYAEPNYISQAKTVPNDPTFSFNLQWGLSLMGLPAAWEVTTGSPAVIVAVLDTGVRFTHPDLTANLLTTGFDFVSDPELSGDGDGIDPDPTDPLTDFPSFHGTHVAGTISAVTNNEIGMAGVAWNVKIMPVRVLHLFGGTVADIINGLRYAAGLSNASGTVPPQPARVINMSLGGPVSCPQAFQDALTAVRNSGVTVVVAAGNDYLEGNPVMSPASCSGVITVGAVDRYATRARYSGVQPYVFIAAPGGDMENDSFLGGVLSTFNRSATGQSLYQFLQGTSMAAPHVSGVVSLMLSANSALTPSQIENILSATAAHRGAAGRNSEYGFGLINAPGAVAQAKGVTLSAVPVPYPLEPLLFFTSPVTSYFDDNIVINTGGGVLTLSSVSTSVGTPSSGTWLSAALFDSVSTCGATTITEAVTK